MNVTTCGIAVILTTRAKQGRQHGTTTLLSPYLFANFIRNRKKIIGLDILKGSP